MLKILGVLFHTRDHFLVMSRIENWLRILIEQYYFTNLSIVYNEKSISNKIFSEEILKELVKTQYRLQYVNWIFLFYLEKFKNVKSCLYCVIKLFTT